MPITIGSNIASLGAQRAFSEATNKVATASERLASGMRINRASDDAAGLSIANQLNSDSRVFTQGIRNINAGGNLKLLESQGELEGIVEELNEDIEELKQMANVANSQKTVLNGNL